MKVAFLHDAGNADGTKGGAELTMDEFAAAAPDTIQFTELHEAETVVIGNCVTISPEIIPQLMGRNVWRYHHDLARHENPVLREWLEVNAQHIFTSPLHQERYGLDGHLIPPAVDLDRFRPNRQTRRNRVRKGTVTLGAWQNPGKGGDRVAEWAARQNEPVACFGFGPFVPQGPAVTNHGPVDPGALPSVLWGFERFVFLPTSPEPFGRCVVEAWAAGLEVITNELVGARYWIENQPDRLETATQDFWGLIHG